MDYCKNSKLLGVGEHMEGSYPLKCDLCKENPMRIEKRGRPPRFSYNPKTVIGGITGPDVWPNREDKKIYDNRYKL